MKYILSLLCIVIFVKVAPTHLERGPGIGGIVVALIHSMMDVMRTLISVILLIPLMGQNSGHVARVIQLIDRIWQRTLEKQYPKSQNFVPIEDGKTITFQDLFIRTPTGRPLNEFGLSCTLSEHENTLIMGPSCGKSSLFRVLAGLWPFTKGEITLPKKDILFLPQKPYMITGNLRELILFPSVLCAFSPSDEEIQECLKLANLEYLLSRFTLESIEIWGSVLSQGEQQRLGFARLFLHKPKFAVLDESTSALDLENEEAMYKRSFERGITVLSVGNRDTLMEFHLQLLVFDGKGGWELFREQVESLI